MAESNGDVASVLVMAAAALFWIAMLGLLWRRSLVGMLIGILIGWISVGMVAIGFGLLHQTGIGAEVDRGTVMGGALVFCVSVVGCLQIAIGLGVVVSRIRSRGTLDADDAGLLEG